MLEEEFSDLNQPKMKNLVDFYEENLENIKDTFEHKKSTKKESEMEEKKLEEEKTFAKEFIMIYKNIIKVNSRKWFFDNFLALNRKYFFEEGLEMDPKIKILDSKFRLSAKLGQRRKTHFTHILDDVRSNISVGLTAPRNQPSAFQFSMDKNKKISAMRANKEKGEINNSGILSPIIPIRKTISSLEMNDSSAESGRNEYLKLVSIMKDRQKGESNGFTANMSIINEMDSNLNSINESLKQLPKNPPLPPTPDPHKAQSIPHKSQNKRIMRLTKNESLRIELKLKSFSNQIDNILNKHSTKIIIN